MIFPLNTLLNILETKCTFKSVAGSCCCCSEKEKDVLEIDTKKKREQDHKDKGEKRGESDCHVYVEK